VLDVPRRSGFRGGARVDNDYAARASRTDGALEAGNVAPRLAAGLALGRGGRYLAGGVLLGLGLFAALTGPRGVK
jgi:hypothetical protein